MRQRRGLGILSDLTWLLVFVLAVILLFFFAFKPLVDNKFVESVAKNEQLAALRTDAAYIAVTLPELEAIGGTQGGKPARFADAVIQLIEDAQRRRSTINYQAANAIGPGAIPADPDRLAFSDFDDVVAASSYSATLDALFKEDSGYWTGVTERTGNGPVLVGIAVVLFDDGKRLDETCKEYHPTGELASPLCILSEKESWTQSASADVGTVTLPTASGTGTIAVYLHWRGRDS